MEKTCKEQAFSKDASDLILVRRELPDPADRDAHRSALNVVPKGYYDEIVAASALQRRAAVLNARAGYPLRRSCVVPDRSHSDGRELLVD